MLLGEAIAPMGVPPVEPGNLRSEALAKAWAAEASASILTATLAAPKPLQRSHLVRGCRRAGFILLC